MDFRIRAKEFSEALDHPILVATTQPVKDHEYSFKVTVESDDNGLRLLSDNGAFFFNYRWESENYADSDFSAKENGSITIKAKELKEVINSFNLNDTLNVRTVSSEDSQTLNISLERDPEVFQSLAIFEESIPNRDAISKEVEKASKKAQVRRDLFVSSQSKISFAFGFEDHRQKYLYWVLRLSENKARFASGTGGRFAILDFEGEDINDVSEPVDILVPNSVTPLLNKILGKMSCDMMTLAVTDSGLYVEADNSVMLVPNYDADIEWVNEDTFLKRDSDYKMSVRLGDWPSIIKGLMATYTDEVRKSNSYHYTSLTIDPEDSTIVAEASSRTMKSKRKAKFTELDGEMTGPLKIVAETQFFHDALTSFGEEDYSQWEFMGEGSTSPLVIRFYADPEIGDPDNFFKINEASGLKERYSVFVALRAEED